MAENSAIEWTDHTFNPWIGCTAVSPACDHCYAETLMDKRYGRVKWGPHGDCSITGASTWRQPRLWQKRAAEFFAEHGRRQRVFCASLADVFDNKAPEGARDRLWSLIRETPDLDWLLLTKRPQNIAKMLPAFWEEIRGHVWLGVSTENQEELERRSLALLRLYETAKPPAVTFASAEPLLGPLDFNATELAFDWIITGGETGPGARPTNPQWFREVRDQCAAEGTAYIHKQNGDWVSVSEVEGPGDIFRFTDQAHPEHNGRCVRRVGKKRAGRTLDGVTHDGFPSPHSPLQDRETDLG